MTDLSGTNEMQLGAFILILVIVVIAWCVLDYLAEREQEQLRKIPDRATEAQPANRREAP